MCGIAGIFSHQDAPRHGELMAALTTSLRPRGPDHQATVTIPDPNGVLHLAHTRLSIIDLSTSANQPMWDREKRFCIVFNGEVYNHVELRATLSGLGHQFQTRSDTEVILRAFREWGPERAANSFNGMFAFCIYDRDRSRVWLFRDRFGVKPLFFREEADTLYFASTTPELARRLKLAPNLDYVARGLRYWVYEDDTTISPYVGLSTLPAGHGLEAWIEGSTLRTRLFRYYDLENRVAQLREELSGRSSAALLDRFADTMMDSVQIRLRADVPIGVSLSGGLDSACISGMAAQLQDGLVGFHFGHPRAIETEGAAVDRLCAHAKIQPMYIRPTATQMAQAFFDCLEAQDAPFPSGTIPAQFLVFKAAREHGFKVLLGGQGSDESLMGYRKFSIFRLEELIARREFASAALFAATLAPRFFAELRRVVDNFWYAARYRAVGSSRLMLPFPSEVLLGYDPRSPLWKRAILDVTTCSLPTILRYEDRSSMGSGVESRLPFLDYRMVELALALPESVRVRNGYGKWILRQAARDLIPERIRRARYKFGFTVNVNSWIDKGLGAALRSRLHDRADRVLELLPRGSDLDGFFSDRILKSGPTPLAELVTLLWLSERA